MLEQYRKQIDQIDQQIILLLAKRLEIVQKIWEYKKQNNIQPLQPKRWKEVLKTRTQTAKQYWLDSIFIKDIWERLHKEALRIENNLNK